MGAIGREHEELKDLGDTNSKRQGLRGELTRLIKENPVLKDKLEMPKMEPSSPRAMIDHKYCSSPFSFRILYEFLFAVSFLQHHCTRTSNQEPFY